MDVECFEAVDESLDGFDVVLQLEDGGNKSLNNAVMAGMPGHPLWAKMQTLMHERCARGLALLSVSAQAVRWIVACGKRRFMYILQLKLYLGGEACCVL